MESEEFAQFIEAWGSMGDLWGINRSMARVHALVILSEHPVDLDTVSRELKISRGNASMCLKELRNWGVIKRVHISGDRRDFYVVENDTHKMFFRIAKERKKRELDPALYALRQLLENTDTGKSQVLHQRLTQIESILATMDRILDKLLADENKIKSSMSFIKNFL